MEAHVFDVAFHQWTEAMRDPRLWLRLYHGHSLFGALLGVALTASFWVRMRRLDPALYADVVAVGCGPLPPARATAGSPARQLRISATPPAFFRQRAFP
jgi:hypothetical protein